MHYLRRCIVIAAACFWPLHSVQRVQAVDNSVNSSVDSSVDRPVASSGVIERVADLAFADITARPVDVWLPPEYPKQAPYDVLYMHDGQMLFDASITWNHQEWRVDEVASQLQQAKRVRPFIVVAVWNAGADRMAEYMPQKAFEQLTPEQQDDHRQRYAKATGLSVSQIKAPYSDRYLKFLVHELKPVIDKKYRVNTAAKNTAIMGSSMGGLVSLYALAEYPEIFGSAACLSTHWPGSAGDTPDNPVPPVFFQYIEQKVPNAGTHRLYFDHGTQTLDASYADHQRRVNGILKTKGYADDDLLSSVFVGAEHNETSWAQRLHLPMTFLFSSAN